MQIFEELIKTGQIKMPYSEEGVYSYGGVFLSICQGIDDWFLENVKKLYRVKEEMYPAFMPIDAINKVGYFSKFPTMPYIQYPIQNNDEEYAASISKDAKRGKIGRDYFLMNHSLLDFKRGKVFNPSTCYHTFLNHSGKVIEGELEVYSAVSQCNRNEVEIGKNPMRLRNFRMREAVFIGTKDLVERNAEDFFELLFEELMLLNDDINIQYASDMFFGLNAETIKEYQMASKVKKELIMQIDSLGEKAEKIELSCGSRNLHKDFLCKCFDVHADGYKPESSCVAIGIERLAYALVSNCGMNPKEWKECELKKLICERMSGEE